MTKATDDDMKQRIRDELTRIRDKARLRIHLLSLDARNRWAEVEKRIEGLELALDGGAEKLANVSRRVVELRGAVSKFLADQSPAPELRVPVSRIMTRGPRTCRASDSLADAAATLWNEDLGALPVLSEDGRVIGMVTDRDICMAAYTQGRGLDDVPVRVAMSRMVHACSTEDAFEGIVESMGRNQVRRLPVVATDGRLVGIVTLGDLCRFTATFWDSEAINRIVLRLLTRVSGLRRVSVSTAA